MSLPCLLEAAKPGLAYEVRGFGVLEQGLEL